MNINKNIMLVIFIGFILTVITRIICIFSSQKITKEKNHSPYSNIKGAESNTAEMVEYSKETSKNFGFSYFKTEFKRPLELRRKGYTQKEEIQLELDKSNLKEGKFAEALKQYIPLKCLYTQEDFQNKSVRVFVDSVIGSISVVRDNTAVYKLLIDQGYDIAGEFVLINLDKRGDEITVNYILKD